MNKFGFVAVISMLAILEFVDAGVVYCTVPFVRFAGNWPIDRFIVGCSRTPVVNGDSIKSFVYPYTDEKSTIIGTHLTKLASTAYIQGKRIKIDYDNNQDPSACQNVNLCRRITGFTLLD